MKQNKRSLPSSFFSGICLLLIACMACNEDKGNYEYSSINEIEISNIEEEGYTYLVGETTAIYPEIKFSLGYEDDCVYQWILLKSQEPVLLAETKNLEVPVAGVLAQLGTHLVYYQVTNVATGVTYIKGFNIFVTTELSLGFLVLNDVNNQTRLDLINLYDSKLTLYKDIISYAGSQMPVDGKPWNVVTYTDQNSPTLNAPTNERYAVVILTDKGTWRLNPITYEYNESYSMSTIIFNDDPAYFPNGHIAEKLVSQSNHYAYLYANGNWYFYKHDSMYPMFFNMPLNVNIADYQRYTPSEHILPGTTNTILFNEDSQSFVFQRHSSYSSQMMMTTDISAEYGTLFPYNNIDKANLELVFMDRKERLTPTVGFIVFRNTNTNDYYVARVKINTFEQESFDRIVGDDIVNAQFFRIHPNTSTDYLFFYYATEDKIYECSFQNNAGSQMQSTLVYTAPAGHKISLMDYCYTGGSTIPSGPWRYYMAVATYDPNDSTGEEGTLTFYESTPFTGGPLTVAEFEGEKMSWKGFGKIVGIDYKTK